MNPAARTRPALLAGGLRPFFLLAGLQAVVTVAVLVTALHAGTWPADALPLTRWHGHEMLLGLVAAAIAGFLLTAVPGWTGREPYAGAPLAALALLWLAGRLALAPGVPLPGWLAAAVDLAFFPALAVALATPLIRAGQARNLGFLAILAGLFLANLGFHLSARGGVALPFDPLLATVDLIAVLVAVVGGRIVPAFTLNALAARGVGTAVRPKPWLDRLAIAALVLVLAGDLVFPATAAAGVLAGAAALLHAWRLTRWQGHRTLHTPLLWVLHLGYAWLPAGLALKATWLLTGAPPAANWLHALTAGCFATMILAVMTRAALGHTGRALVAPRPMVAAYLLLTAGALMRVLAPALAPGAYLAAVGLAGTLWGLAFALFVVVYAPILLGARVDGKPG